MKYILFFSALFFFNTNSAQTISDITGNWINYKTEMKDGSKLYQALPSDSTANNYFINANKFGWTNCINGIYGMVLDYKLINNEIQTSQFSGFKIEKISKDSLVLCERINDTPDDKLQRLYLVREEVIIAKYKEKYKNESNIVATTKYTPKIKSSFLKLLNQDLRKNNSYYNFRFSGKLFIFPQEKKIETKIIFSTTDSPQIKKITKYLNSSFEDWDLTNFETYKTIEIPFIYQVKKDEWVRGTDIRFFVDDVTIFNHIMGVTIENQQKSLNYFKKAFELYQEKKFLKAAELFEKSFEIDPRNLDALYNKAAAFSEIGDKENACKTWKRISDFGQVSAQELYKNNCN